MRLILASLLVLGACIPGDDAPDTNEVESHDTTYQGTTYQGTTYQGTTYQGTTYQGTTYQGTTYQGAFYGSSPITGTASVTKSTLEVWRKITSTTWEQRTPTWRCTWNSDKTEEIGCTSYNLATQVSPLGGMRFRGRFYDPNTGLTRNGYLRIKSVVGAVSPDTTYAMHPLTGAGAGGALMAYNGTTCTNLDGCRKNSDLYLYDLELLDTDGSSHPFCYPGERAFAFAGTWDLTGKFTASSSQFTFACTNGTIAKCARWGYRPFGVATTVGAQHISKSMAPYHQSCVRAATADYCANGTSFTHNNTLIDVYDYEPHASYAYGFIPRMQSILYVTNRPGATALQWESRFDNVGATELDFERYDDHDVGSVCGFTFSLGTAPSPDEPHQPKTRDPSTFSGPWISVDTSTVCQHDETTVGSPLDFRCSKCTTKFFGLTGSGYEHCTARKGYWGQDCVDLAKQSWWCAASDRMAAHSECTSNPSTPLYQYASACTLRLCSNPAYASCCTSSWTSSCTAAANEQCVGGAEGLDMFGRQLGFCGKLLGGLILSGG